MSELTLDDLAEFELVERIQIQRNMLNADGTVFGGWTLSQSDCAAGILAERLVNGPIVTACVRDFCFRRPGLLSDIFEFYAKISNTGRTSITVNLEIMGLRYYRCVPSLRIHFASALFIFVAVDDQGRPRAIPVC